MIVRFITKRFIGDYDPNAPKSYAFRYHVDNEEIFFQLIDGSGLPDKPEHMLEADLKRADAFILMYSVTDKCSFDDTNRLKFLITYAKRRKKMCKDLTLKDFILNAPVLLVGNKTDQHGDRMVTMDEGHKRYKDISCESFHEISVRESYEEVCNVFEDVCRYWRIFNKCPKLKRSRSDVQNGGWFVTSPDHGRFYFSNSFRREKRSSQSDNFKKSDECFRSDDNKDMRPSESGQGEPFRSRACTDGTILARPKRCTTPSICITYPMRLNRRMSISLRGSNSSNDWPLDE
ncbi:ras-related and estrogen-regulated growth inhibitor isoform X2 [Bradysia coprophila]|nr:ras-related and estrogen-regulated growth inhibitor isoform X2 [Bradysia coprophila]XP_037047592.1 ras-related and estrogen-regulated growth inhibitor isoform X2 [Bradysia coprophila]